ncbi:MAG: hypothetical protein O2973_00045 [Gemmatimonadetes bacterium]|nr:hypothetical protein [Gemmatimonadota bacterium]
MRQLRLLLGDPSVRWLAGARVIALLAAPVTMYLLVTRQQLSARGFYIIAINIVALGQLFETGMGTLVVQFAARVRPSERGTLRGATERWYSRAALTLLAIGATFGSYVFAIGANSASVNFLVPWVLVLGCTAAYIRLVPLVCMREGGGGAESVQRMRAVQALMIAGATVLGLWSGPGIRAAAWAAVVQLAVVAVYLFRERGKLPVADLSAERLADQYRAEQSRSARVWVALWIAPQLLTPAAMFLHGARVAGDVGLHVALALAPLVLSVAWMHARYPRLGALAASGALQTFDDTARHAFVQAAWVFLGTSAVLLLLAIVGPHYLSFLAGRVLSPLMLSILIVGTFALVVMQGMLAWFRAFGDEKFAAPVVVACAGMALGGVLGAAVGGAMGAATGYSAVGAVVTAILAIGFLRLRSQRLGSAE